MNENMIPEEWKENFRISERSFFIFHRNVNMYHLINNLYHLIVSLQMETRNVQDRFNNIFVSI